MPVKPTKLPPPSADWAYFMDVDGTLIHLADTPDAVSVPAALISMIADSFARCGGALAVISGRSLAGLESLLPLPWLPMAGLHGLERRDSYGHVHAHALSPAVTQAVTDWLAPLQKRHPGLLLENKGGTLAIHYRRAPRLGGHLHRHIDALLPGLRGLHVQKGKYVLELKPQGYDKGTAIQEFMLQQPFKDRCPVFIGDDLTDEHGFAAVNAMRGISVKVGRGKTQARYRLPDVDSVRAWLGTMTKRGKGSSS